MGSMFIKIAKLWLTKNGKGSDVELRRESPTMYTADRAPVTLPTVLIPATEDDAPVDEFSSVMSAMMDDDDEDATGAKKGYTFKNCDDDEEEEDDDGGSNSSENDNDSNC